VMIGGRTLFRLLKLGHCPIVCGTASQTQSRTQSATPNSTAGPHDAVIGVYDEAGNVIETREHAGEFKEW
jgi:hypothetical protein